MRPAYWAPPAIWMGFILCLSSDSFNAAETGAVLAPLLRWLLRGVTDARIEWIHSGIRTLAHPTVYAVLALLWYRAFAQGGGVPARRAARLALALTAAWAGVDEGHQAMVASRTGSFVDVAVDSTGAAIALAGARLGRGPLGPPDSSPLRAGRAGGPRP